MSGSGKKSLLRDVCCLWRSWWSWQGDCMFSVILWPLTLGLPAPTAAGSADVTWPLGGLTVASSSKHLWGFSLPLTLSPHGERSPVSILDQPWPRNLLPHLTCVASRCCDLNWAPSSARVILAFLYTGEPSCQLCLLRYCELQLCVSTGLSFLLLLHHAREKRTIKKWKVVYPFHISYPIMKEALFWSRLEGRRCHIMTSLQID